MSEKFPEPNSLDSTEGLLRQDIPVDFEEGDIGPVPIRFENKEQVSVVQLSAEMWEQYKTIRLRSGETDPQAFGSSIQKERDQTEGYWRSKLEDPSVQMFAVEAEGRIAAMAGLQKKPDGRFLLRRVYVAPEMRGKGFAQLLIDRVFAEAKARGAKSIELDVAEEQQPALKLYEKLGFERFDTKQEEKGDGKIHNEILMRKNLQ